MAVEGPLLGAAALAVLIGVLVHRWWLLEAALLSVLATALAGGIAVGKWRSERARRASQT